MKFTLLFIYLCLSFTGASNVVSYEEFITLKNELKELAKSVAEIASSVRNPGILRLNDSTIEERVTLLEFQVDILNDDVETVNAELVDQAEDLDRIEGEIAILSADQVLQDERLLELEMDSDDFEDAIATLDAMVTTVNSTLSQAVMTLDSDLTSLEMNVSALEDYLETELTVLQETITEIDGRLQQLELLGIVAFQADLNEYTSIPIDSVVLFDVVRTNIGNGYNDTTGQFTVPAMGAGLYFFYANFFAENQEIAHFLIRINDQPICQAGSDMSSSGIDDNGTPSCAAVATLVEGDVVDVFYDGGMDDTPVLNNALAYNTFTGFRIAPE